MASASKDIVAYLDQVPAESLRASDAARSEVLEAAERLVARLRTPIEQLFYCSFAPPVAMGAIQTFQELGLWEAWHKAGGGQKSLADLVGMASAPVETNLLRRIVRVLTAFRMIDEVGEDRYSATRFVAQLGNEETFTRNDINAHSDHWVYGGLRLAPFLKQTGYKEPLNPQETAYKHANPEKLEFWTRCKEHPPFQASFGGAMESWSRQKMHWPDFYDTNELVKGADLNSPLLVDVGGNIGNDLGRFLAKHPDIPAGSLVLQDRPEALALAKLNSKIKAMPHDFFTPQPVTGSRAYFLHAVLHDWPDKEGTQILQHIAKAMKKGYSKLLICDIALPATQASATQAVLDVAMMGLISACERTRQDWKKLLEVSGFKIVKWWDDPQKYETLIEAELA